MQRFMLRMVALCLISSPLLARGQDAEEYEFSLPIGEYAEGEVLSPKTFLEARARLTLLQVASRWWNIPATGFGTRLTINTQSPERFKKAIEEWQQHHEREPIPAPAFSERALQIERRLGLRPDKHKKGG